MAESSVFAISSLCCHGRTQYSKFCPKDHNFRWIPKVLISHLLKNYARSYLLTNTKHTRKVFIRCKTYRKETRVPPDDRINATEQKTRSGKIAEIWTTRSLLILGITPIHYCTGLQDDLGVASFYGGLSQRVILFICHDVSLWRNSFLIFCTHKKKKHFRR